MRVAPGVGEHRGASDGIGEVRCAPALIPAARASAGAGARTRCDEATSLLLHAVVANNSRSMEDIIARRCGGNSARGFTAVIRASRELSAAVKTRAEIISFRSCDFSPADPSPQSAAISDRGREESWAMVAAAASHRADR